MNSNEMNMFRNVLFILSLHSTTTGMPEKLTQMTEREQARNYGGAAKRREHSDYSRRHQISRWKVTAKKSYNVATRTAEPGRVTTAQNSLRSWWIRTRRGKKWGNPSVALKHEI